MRVLILGASGRTGKLVVEDTLKKGHTVTALVRNPTSLPPQDNLTIVRGTPLSQTDITTAFSATPSDPIRTVIIALNATRTSDSPFAAPLAPPNFIRDSVRNTTAVMADYGVRRIVIMSAFGVGSSWKQLPWVMKALFSCSNMRFQIDDHNATDAEVRGNEGLEWTLVRPVRLVEGEAAVVREMGEVGEGVGLMSGISRASVAEFLVKAALEERLSRRAVVISN